MLAGIKHIYFLGIGGIGMSALARYFIAKGFSVSGYDKTATDLTDELIAEGIKIHYDENIETVKNNLRNYKTNQVLVVYTPAIPTEHKEYIYFSQNNFCVKKRAEVLGEITKANFTIAVAGTHGKTTTSSIVTHLLRSANIDCSAFLGGITQNYKTNFLIGTDNTVVIEADEYDRSFLTLYPDILIITSVDSDHLDIYGTKTEMHETYKKFVSQLKEGGKLIVHHTVANALNIIPDNKTVFTYSLAENTSIKTTPIKIEDAKFCYDILINQSVISARMQVPGRHNAENAVAAAAAAYFINASEQFISAGLNSFKGVKRRFEYHINNDKLKYIDDYAHHPEELKACFTAAKDLFPTKKITAVFQPHLYSRTRDFADEFATTLSMPDEIILLDIYPAREKPIEGITSQMLLDKIQSANKMLCAKAELVAELKKRKLEVLITVGAGDIDNLISPIKNALQ